MDPELIRKAYFSTTTRGALPDHFSTNKLHASRAVVDRVHYRSISNPPPWKPSEAPPMDKDYCEYHREYVTRDLSNAKVDREAAALFLENGRSGGHSQSGQKLEGVPVTKATYIRHTKDGRGVSYKPEMPVHIDVDSKLLEVESSLKRDFQRPDPKLAAQFRGERIEPPAGVPMDHNKVFAGKTDYNREFSASKLGFRPCKFPNPESTKHGGGKHSM